METENTERPALAVQARFRGQLIDERMLRWRSGERYRIGVTPRAAAPAPDLLGLAFLALVESTPDGYRLRVTLEMDGTISSEGRVYTLRAWAMQHGASFLLPPGAQACLACGDMEYHIDWSEPPPPVRAPLVQLRWSEQRYTAGTGVLMLLVMLLASFVPPDARALSLQQLGRDFRLLPFRLVPPEEPPATRAGVGPAAPAAPGTAAAGPAGRAGRPNARGGGDLALRRPDTRTGITALGRAAEVKASGLLALLYAPDHPALAGLFDRDAVGVRAEDVLTGLLAVKVDDLTGVGALGVRDSGAGGAGVGEGTIGVGRLGTIGLRGPGGPGVDYGGAASRLTTRRARGPEVSMSTPTVRGALDREIIRRVVRRHINEIRYCYEQELVRAPTLTGRVAVRFTIAPSGQVASAAIESSTFEGPSVPLCVAQAVRRWQFPQPQGGGIVMATYPFTFTPAGQAR
jgi:TonB family protein